jgi:hypothetical protein
METCPAPLWALAVEVGAADLVGERMDQARNCADRQEGLSVGRAGQPEFECAMPRIGLGGRRGTVGVRCESPAGRSATAQAILFCDAPPLVFSLGQGHGSASRSAKGRGWSTQTRQRLRKVRTFGGRSHWGGRILLRIMSYSRQVIMMCPDPRTSAAIVYQNDPSTSE